MLPPSKQAELRARVESAEVAIPSWLSPGVDEGTAISKVVPGDEGVRGRSTKPFMGSDSEACFFICT